MNTCALCARHISEGALQNVLFFNAHTPQRVFRKDIDLLYSSNAPYSESL